MRGRRHSWLLLGLLAACRGPGSAGDEHRTRLVFRGQQTLAEKELRRVAEEELFERPGVEPSKVDVDDAAFALEELYRGQGYADARVEYEFRSEGRRPRATFVIAEGRHVRLSEVDLRGAQSFERAELLDFFPSAGEDYVARRMAAGTRALRAYYAGHGFLRARVPEPETRLDPEGGTAAVLVRVEEGPRFVVRSVQVEAPEPAREPLQKIAGAAVGSPYTRRLAEAVRADLLHHQGEAGRPDCEVEVEVSADQQSGDVALSFRVEPGERVTVAAIRVEGNRGVKERVILRRLALEQGALYRSSDVRESFQRLYETGLFESVELELEGTGAERSLLVRVVERPSLELSVEPGYGSYEGLRLRVSLAENDLFGTARNLRVSSVVSELAQRADVDLTEPRLFGGDFSGGLSFFGNHREEPSFTLVEVGTGATLTRRWTSELRTSLGYGYRKTRTEDVEVLTTEASELESDVDVSSITSSIERDTTRDPFDPRRGSRSRAQVEWASRKLGSEIDFVGGNLLHSRYLRLGARTTLGFSARGAVIFPIADEEIPLQLRLFLGGENSVRSYREQELGPKDEKGEPIGGEISLLGSVELRQELWDALSGAVFVDAGFVSAGDIGDDDLGLMPMGQVIRPRDGGLGVGLGLRYLLPIGHVRLDGAVNPAPEDDEDTFVVHLAVGMAF